MSDPCNRFKGMTSASTPQQHSRRSLVWVPQRTSTSPGVSSSGWSAVPDAEQMLSNLVTGTGAQQYVVHGGPATGKSSLLAAAIAAVVSRGIAPNRILAIGSSARSVAQLRDFIDAAFLAQAGEMANHGLNPQVRTVHSLAFAVMAAAAGAIGVSPPRLLTGAEHDAIFRQALAGYSADGGLRWPEAVRPALATRGFARELRDVVLRTTERSVAPERLAEMGETFERPLWVLAADFARRHEQEMELRTASLPAAEGFPTQLNAAQLVGRATEELDADPSLMVGGRAVEVLIVDNAQLIDPMGGELLMRFAEQAKVVIVAHDPDTAVFRFRGANDKFVQKVQETAATVSLTRSWRDRDVLLASALFARRLPGHEPWRQEVEAHSEAAAHTDRFAPVAWHAAATVNDEAAAIADYLLRLHYLHDIPWKRMAIIQRSVGAHAELLQRTFDAYGVPVVDAGAEVPPADDPLVAALLDVLESALETPNEAMVRRLLVGPLGQADPADLRDLRRLLRERGREDAETPSRSMEAIRELLLADTDPAEVLGEDVPGRLLSPLQRIRMLRAVVQEAIASDQSVEMVVWELWHATRKAHTLLDIVIEGGVAGRAADRSADAVLDLVDHAADFVEQLPRGTLRQFIEMLREQELPAPRRIRRSPRNAVSLLSAHNSVASEFDVVVIAGLQDGVWPAPRRRFGLFELELLIDLLDNPEFETLSQQEREAAAMAAAAADERRLIVLAASRATRHVLFTAVDSTDGELGASQFFDELHNAGIPQWAALTGDDEVAGHRVFGTSSLVADARQHLLDRSTNDATRHAVARVLKTLATHGVDSADPHNWYRGRTVSSTSSPFPQRASGARVRISPSGLETLETCPLRWFISKQLSASVETPMLRGQAIHLAAQALDSGVAVDDVVAAITDVWPVLSGTRGWAATTENDELEQMVRRLHGWLQINAPAYSSQAVEQQFAMEIRSPAGQQFNEQPAETVLVNGRIDRIDVDADGRFRTVDFKTATSPMSKDEAVTNPQLALYQLALRLGAFTSVGARREETITANVKAAPNDYDEAVNQTAGGVLVYVHPKVGNKVTERHQSPLTTEGQHSIMGRVVVAGAQSLGPVFTAAQNSQCSNCAARAMCPIQSTGKQVGQ